MTRIRQLTQLELEGFGAQISEAEEGGVGVTALSASEVRERSMAFFTALGKKIEDAEEPPDWSRQYHRLINAGLPWRVACFIGWASSPQPRYPKTQEELAREMLGLTSDRAIATWRKKYPAIDQMIADLQAESLLLYRADAFHALGKLAGAETYRANPDRRLFFEMTRDYVPRQKVETERRSVKTDMRDLSDAELENMAGDEVVALLKNIRDEEDDAPSVPYGTPTLKGTRPPNFVNLGEDDGDDDDDGDEEEDAS